MGLVLLLLLQKHGNDFGVLIRSFESMLFVKTLHVLIVIGISILFVLLLNLSQYDVFNLFSFLLYLVLFVLQSCGVGISFIILNCL